MRFEILARHPSPRSWTRRWPGCHRPSNSTRRSTNCSPPRVTARPGSARRSTSSRSSTTTSPNGARGSPRRGARSSVVSMETARVVGTKGLAGQVIDILIDNALRHGRGSVTLLVEDTSVTVIDQGPGLSDDAGQIRVRGPERSVGASTGAACPSPDAWRRSTEAASTSPPPGRCASVTGWYAADRQSLRHESAQRRSAFTTADSRKSDRPKTSRRLQEAGTLEAASGRKHQQSAQARVRARLWLGVKFLQSLKATR